MHKRLLVSTVSSLVLMSGAARADTTVTDWQGLTKAVKETGGTIILDGDIETSSQTYPYTSGIIGEKIISGTVIEGNGYTLRAPKTENLYDHYRFIYNSVSYPNVAPEVPLVINNVNFDGGHIIDRDDGAKGGAIYNYNAPLGNIAGSFSNNYAESQGSYAYGGAISNNYNASIGNITGNFDGNYVKAATRQAQGGAIYNEGSATKIGNIVGNFNRNHADGNSAYGGAIYNSSATIGLEDGGINGSFNGNYAVGSAGDTQGGAIYNYSGKIYGIKGNFDGNKAEGKNAGGGAIFNSGGKIGLENGGIVGNFTNNKAYDESYRAWGGAIYNFGNGTINYIEGNFEQNSVEAPVYAAYGGAIHNQSSTINSIRGNFIGNYAEGGEAGSANGGAIYNQQGTIGEIEGSFLNNYVSGNAYSNGGAIYSDKDITIVAREDRTSKFEGNYVVADGNRTSNAIYMESKDTVLNLKTASGGIIDFEDEIDGTKSGYNISVVSEDGSGSVIFNNNIHNADISLTDTDVTLGNVDFVADNNSLTLNSGVLNIATLGKDQILTANSITLNGGLLNFAEVEVDLANENMGTIDGEVLSVADGAKINVEKMLLTSEAKDATTQITFIENKTGVAVEYNGDNPVQQAVAPIYKYNVGFNADEGAFIFTRAGEAEANTGSNSGSSASKPEYDWLNPGVFAGDVFAKASLNMQDTVVKEIMAMDPNKVYCTGRVWAMPFYNDDTISYKRFYDVDSTNYGLIAGIDTRPFGEDTNIVYTLFGAYGEGKDKYESIRVKDKNWMLGLKTGFYNDNGFYGDATVDVASHDMEAKTYFGKDSYDTYGYGAAARAGYKYGFDEVTVDAGAMLSWQQIKGKDFTASSGARMKADDYSRWSLIPQIKISYELDIVRPYALARYNFMLDDKGSGFADDVTLPELEDKDYVEYGLGIETAIRSNHSGFAHILRHDGGREGWGLTAGYRYNF